jgi:type IV secretory pathway VirB2 component (pilin)
VLPAAFLFRALMFVPIVAIEFFWGNIAPRYYIIISIIDGISFVYGGAAFAPSYKRVTQLVLGIGYFLWGTINVVVYYNEISSFTVGRFMIVSLSALLFSIFYKKGYSDNE